MAAKQEVITEAAEGVVPVSTRARAPSAGVALYADDPSTLYPAVAVALGSQHWGQHPGGPV